MPVQVNDFVIPESDYRGLHQVANTMERKRERDYDIAQRERGRKASTAAFLSNYLDPKDNLTGTPYDPQIVAGFDALLQEGAKLASEGADANMMMMALSPKVAKLNQYSTTAKLVNQRLKDQLTPITANSGYDKAKLEEVGRRTAFYNPDGSLKDINTIDPSVDWITEAIKYHPEEVTNDMAIDEFVKNSPKYVNTDRVKRTNAKGGYELKKSKITAPSWAIVDDEGEIVPKYETAMNEGNPVMHEFVDKTGNKVSAPVRLMNEKDFDAMMSSNRGIADWVRGQVKLANPEIDINSTQAKQAARAIMYDELKRRGGGGIEDIEETKANPAPRISVHVNNGGAANLNNIYERIKEKGLQRAKDYKEGNYFDNSLSKGDLDADELEVILKGTQRKDLTPDDVKVIVEDNGRIGVYDKGNGERLVYLNQTGTNLPKQANVAGKKTSVELGNKSFAPNTAEMPKGETVAEKMRRLAGQKQ